MNQTIVDNYNSIVGVNDISYILGDLFFGGKDFAREFMKKLVPNSKVMLIGNHDENRSKSFYRSIGFEEVHNQLVINIKGQDFLLTHRPNPDSLIPNLCGHVHQAWTKNKNSLNVGVDVHNFFPINADTVIKFFGH